MNVLCTCAYCGQSCYDLDAVEVKKLPNSYAGKFGEEFSKRTSTLIKPVICKDHLNVDLNETKIYDTFFNDHAYSNLDNPRNLGTKLKTMTICMLCHQNVYEKDIKLHAAQHTSYLDVRDYLCDLHNVKKKPRNYLADISKYCEDCHSRHNKANEFKTKRMINICFPLYVCEFRKGIKHGLAIYLPTDYKNRKIEIFPSRKDRQQKEFEEMMKMIKQEDEDEFLYVVKTEVKEEVEEMEVEEWKEEPEEEEEEFEDDLKNDADFELPSDAEAEVKKDEEYDDPDFYVEEFIPRSTRRRTKDNKIFQQFFEQNAHPTCKQINEFCKENSMRFGFFERAMENWRNKNGVSCEADDSCMKIRLFNELAGLPTTPIDEEKMKECEEVFLKYCEENRNFEKSDAYQYAEEFELNPYSILKAYQVFRKARKVKSKLIERVKKFEEENEGVQNNSLNTKHVAFRVPKLKRIPKEKVKQLLEEYEKEPECDMEKAKRLGKRLGLEKQTVRNWFFRQKKHQGGGKRNELRHTFTEKEKEYLKAKFEENQYPSKNEQNEMAKELNLTTGNVFFFFNSKRTEARKRKEWEVVGNDIKDLPEATINELMKAFNNNPNAKFEDRVKIASDLKLSYQLVTLWFEIKVLEKRKTRSAHSTRKLKSSEDDSEEEEEEDSEAEDPVWESLKLLVADATKNEPERKSLRKSAGRKYFEVSDGDEHKSDEDWDFEEVAHYEEDVGEKAET